jgi:DNA-binding NarL/FixJ family response regulator
VLIHVLIADDHPLVRQGVARALALEPDFAPPGEAGNSRELLSIIERKKWDVILLDLSMPGRGGLEALSDIRRRKPSIPVLVLTRHSESHFVKRAIKAGANGYLTKTAPISELVTAIREVIAGRPYFPAAVAESLVAALTSSGNRPPHEALSDRELLVMCRIAEGKTVAEIAEEVSLSVKTVHMHRARALKKMGMRTNAEFARYALQHKLIV